MARANQSALLPPPKHLGVCAVSRSHGDRQTHLAGIAHSIYTKRVYLYTASECMNVFIMNKISWIHQSSGDCGFTMSEENFYCTIILNVIFFYFVGGNQPVSAQ